MGGIKLQLENMDELNFYRNIKNSALLYSELNQNSRELIAPFMPYSKSQLAQDLFALAFSDSLKAKFFVEFGATDGINGSNTWLLEKKLGWNGILAEPAKVWHKNLTANRKCNIETKCIAKKSGEIYEFLEVFSSKDSSPSLSTLEKFADNDDWAKNIRHKKSKK